MALSTAQNRILYDITESTTRFPFVDSDNNIIPFFSATDIAVSYQPFPEQPIIVYTLDESGLGDNTFRLEINNNDPEQGCDVILNAAVTVGVLAIERVIPVTQQYDLQEGATIDPTALNTALDRLAAQNQQQERLIENAISFPATDPLTTTYNVEEGVDARQFKLLGFDGEGNITTTTVSAAGGGQAIAAGNGISISGDTISVNPITTQFEFFFGRLGIKDGAITLSKMANNSVGNNQLTTGCVTTDKILGLSVTFAKMQAITGLSVLGNVSASSGFVSEVPIDTDLTTGASAIDNELASSKAIVDLINHHKPNIVQNVYTDYRKVLSTKDNSQYAITWEDLDNFNATLNTRQSGSKVKITININCTPQNRNGNIYFRLKRQDINGTIYLDTGDDRGDGRVPASFTLTTNGYNDNVLGKEVTFIDSPNLTSNNNVTYSLQWFSARYLMEETSIVENKTYRIKNLSNSNQVDFTDYGADSNAVGVVFTANQTADLLPKTANPALVEEGQLNNAGNFFGITKYNSWALNGTWRDRSTADLNNAGNSAVNLTGYTPQVSSKIIVEEIYT